MNTQSAITHFLPLTTIRRERLLPVPGRVVARRGQRISPTDVVAEAVTEPEHILLDIGRGLGLSAKEADKYMAVKGGDQVSEGDVLAGPVGVARRLVRSPHDGMVVVAGEGQILLRKDTAPFELKAAYQGVIADLIGDRGVIVETTGALIQGVWGNGHSSYGLLSVLAHAPDEPFSAGQLEVSLRGSVVLAGYCEDEAVFQAGADLPLRGLILASMLSRLIPVASKVGYPVIVIEGFGKIAMNSAAFKLLSSSDRRDLTINANQWDRYTGTRPEVILAVPGSSQAELPDDTDLIVAGKHIRIVSPPYQGQLATVIDVPSSLSILPSGVSAAAATVRLEDGETVLVPLVNLDLID
ncbi:MAG: hypothetical protein JW726_04235 [Anaerolineales bacterium]|nr:hypothetical protein [Anaerolineales bacterium]